MGLIANGWEPLEIGSTCGFRIPSRTYRIHRQDRQGQFRSGARSSFQPSFHEEQGVSISRLVPELPVPAHSIAPTGEEVSVYPGNYDASLYST
jgi:hypothetical protein